MHFLTSAVDLNGCPKDSLPEIALVGRSNAGKSSLINAIAGSRIAQVSNTPGKTRLLNFYQAEKFRWVDMPGYGFAARSASEKSQWVAMIEEFLRYRQNLRGLLIIMDIRRVWSDDERNILAWLEPRDLPSAVVATKTDKVNRSQVKKYLSDLSDESGAAAILPTSTLQKSGFAEVEDFVFSNWIKPSAEAKT